MANEFHKLVSLLDKRKIMVKECIEGVLELIKMKSVRKPASEETLERLKTNLSLIAFVEKKAGAVAGETFLTFQESFMFRSDCVLLRLSLKKLTKKVGKSKKLHVGFGFKELAQLTENLGLNYWALKNALYMFLLVERKANLASAILLDQKRKILNQGFVFRPMSWYSAICVLFIYLITIDSLVTRFL